METVVEQDETGVPIDCCLGACDENCGKRRDKEEVTVVEQGVEGHNGMKES